MKNLRLKTAMFTMIMMVFISSVFGQSTVIYDTHGDTVMTSQGNWTIDSVKTDTITDIETAMVRGTDIYSQKTHNVPNTYSNYYVHFELEDKGGSYDFDIDTNNINVHSGCDNSNCNKNTVQNFKDTILISGNSTISYSISNPNNSGRYQVTSTVYHITDTIFVNSNKTGLKTIDKPTFDANMYPNPSNGRFTISFEKRVDRVEIFNTSGQVVKQFRPYSNTEQVDLSNMSKGVYFVRYYKDKTPSLAKRIFIQ